MNRDLPPGKKPPARQIIKTADGPVACLVPPPGDEAGYAIVRRTVNQYLRDSLGWTLPIRSAAEPVGFSIVAGNASTNPGIAALARKGLVPDILEELGEEGFRIATCEDGDRRCVAILANTPAGLKHGCQELLFFRLSATSNTAWIDWPLDVTMTPAFPYRGVYILPCWSARDSIENWEHVLRFHSELTINRNWFWLAGFPIIEEYGGEYTGTDLADRENVRRLIQLCHAEAMKFQIGGGWFTWHHEKHASGEIDRGIRYYLDLVDLFRDVDGIFLEPTGEGSTFDKNVWQQQIDAFRKLAETIWSTRPGFEFAVAVGKFNDPEYRKTLHEIDDRRIHWWWCWGDPLAQNALAEHPLVLRWHIISPMADYHGSTRPPEPAESDLTGFATSYDPGQGFGNPWNGWGKLGVDHPRNVHPHTMPLFSHQYRFRERCWNPSQSDEEFAARMSRRLFDADMPPESIGLYLELASLCPDPAAAGKTLDRTEAFLQDSAGKGTPRNRDTLARMREALDGIAASRDNPGH